MSAKKQRSSGLSDLEYDIVKREYDEKYELVVPMSLVRLGFTDKELVCSFIIHTGNYCICQAQKNRAIPKDDPVNRQ